MRTIIDLLKDQGYTVRHEPISRSMIYSCDEMFLTGTAAGVMFVESVDGRTIGEDGKEGPVGKGVKEAYQDLIEMRHPRSVDWVDVFAIAGVEDEAYSHI